MSGENSLKKVDYKMMSNQKCPDCGNLLKENKVKKGHIYCYPCFKLRDGKRYAYVYKVVDGIKVQVIEDGKPKIRRDFKKEQTENRRKNNWK
jgi:ribosomal protein L37AE/L43A